MKLNQDLEQLAVVLALGATAFVLWRYWREATGAAKLTQKDGLANTAATGGRATPTDNEAIPKASDLTSALATAAAGEHTQAADKALRDYLQNGGE